MWEKVSTTFMKEDKPYGPGDFRIGDGRVISMKLAKPEITFKAVSECSHPDRAEPTERWMYSSAETLHRTTAKILSGPLIGSKSVVFQELAQRSDWWSSKDGQTIYVMIDWMNYVTASPGKPALHATRLLKSVNGGEDWQPLTWPESKNAACIRFLDAQRGYVIGWGATNLANS